MKSKKIKRIFDFFLSFFVLFYFSLFWTIIMAILFLNNRGKIFYIQKRIGKDEVEFKVIKFRTLEEEKVISCFSHFLRVTALDETPQLFNILKGDMSFAGPRALVKEELLENEQIWKRSRVKPGLTGLAQITVPKRANIADKLKVDLWYIKNYNLTLDIKIILKSLVNTFTASWEANQFKKYEKKQ